MPTNKNALLRYQILDQCFSDFSRKYEIHDLLEKVNAALYELYGTAIRIRQIRDDIKYMRDRMAYNAPIVAYQYDGKKCYYRYDNPDFTIFKNELSPVEIAKLGSTIDMLSRFRGIPANAWLEEVISSLELRFGIKQSKENIVSFDTNEQLRGLQFLDALIDAAINHQPLRIVYRPFYSEEQESIVHPYHLKQYNNRWFLLGYQESPNGNYMTNMALDRIVRFSTTDVPFIPNTNVDFNACFKDIVGVTIPEEHPITERVVLKFDDNSFPYVINKPIHHSQIIVNEIEHILELTVRPNYELEANIASFGEHVDVLEPQWLREVFANKAKKNFQHYFSQK